MDLQSLNHQNILSRLGFTQFNEIQETTIKESAEKENILLLAPTGSGKTVAFLMSAIDKLKEVEGVQVLILAPTRELVLQIESVLKKMQLNVKTNACYGGHPFSVERRNFSVQPTFLIGTPGRIKDHIVRNTFNSRSITHVIFDEFDKSLEFGFGEEMSFIVSKLPKAKNKMLVSATNTIEIPSFLSFRNHTIIDFGGESIPDITLQKIVLNDGEKIDGLLQFVNGLGNNQNAIIFCNHREACNQIADKFNEEGIIYSLYHGALEQDQRESELAKFRNSSSKLLISTDIAARGIDVPELDFVVHYQVPKDESAFIHRNGRTARMKATGTGILIFTKREKSPDYMPADIQPFKFIKGNTISDPGFITLHINKGKKDKVNKIDIVGFLLQFDFLDKADVGLIEVKDFFSYVAVNRNKYAQLISQSGNAKIKKKSVKIAVAT